MLQQTFKAPVVSWFKIFLTITLTIPLLVTDIPVAKADTDVGGPIISDTTWTAANSPQGERIYNSRPILLPPDRQIRRLNRPDWASLASL